MENSPFYDSSSPNLSHKLTFPSYLAARPQTLTQPSTHQMHHHKAWFEGEEVPLRIHKSNRKSHSGSKQRSVRDLGFKPQLWKFCANSFGDMIAHGAWLRLTQEQFSSSLRNSQGYLISLNKFYYCPNSVQWGLHLKLGSLLVTCGQAYLLCKDGLKIK